MGSAERRPGDHGTAARSANGSRRGLPQARTGSARGRPTGPGTHCANGGLRSRRGGRAGMHPAGLSETGRFPVPTPGRRPRASSGWTAVLAWERPLPPAGGRWRWRRMLLETLPETRLWVGAHLRPGALFRRSKGQRFQEAACGEALLFFPQTPPPALPTLPLQGHRWLHG